MELKIQKKLTYLQETKDAIKSALIEKGQTVSDTDTFRSYAEKILAIQGGGATETDVIPEQEFALTLNSQLQVYMASGFDLFSLKSGEKYYVVWGEETFTCTAFDGTFEEAPCVAIGNPYPVGGTGNDMPFIIGCIPYTEEQTLCLIIDLFGQTATTKKVRVYQTSSGASSDLVKWVTFIGADGTEFCDPMPVLNGDDCKNPITHWNLSEPTKESTVSQVFTYNGWALTEGGSADDNALKAVTEDKTVYAAFTATARTYTVRFFDGDTLLATKQVEYGSTATYSVTKENYMFVGWNPDPSNVVEDMDCYAVWEESYAFADASWEYIAQMSESGKAPEVFSIGDRKTIQIGTKTVTLIIADFNYDVLASDTTKTAGMTIITDTRYGSNINHSSIKNLGSYGSGTNKLKTTITEAYDNMPSDLQAVIKPVKKRTLWYQDSSYDYTFSVWPLSCSEVIDGDLTDDSLQHRPYEIFKTPSLLDSTWDKTTSDMGVWSRSRSKNQADYWTYLYRSGDKMYKHNGYYSNYQYVKFGFCI